MVGWAGLQPRLNGAVSVDGPGSEWANSAALTVGDVGVGTLTITASGLVRSASAIVGKSAGGTGTVTVDGAASLWFNSGDIHVGTAGQGLVNLANGGAVQAQNVAIDPFGTLRGNGTIIGSVQNNGLIVPGASVGALQVTGAYTQQAGGVLHIELGGPTPTLFDRVTVAGNALLGGSLQLARVASFIPSPASTFMIFDAGAISGAFANVANGQRLLTNDGFGSFLVNYGPGSPFDSDKIVLSSFVRTIDGDFDFDGDVDGNDFLLWQRGGSPHPNTAADLAVWRNNVGSHSLTATAAAVPEPCSFGLALGTAIVVFTSVRCRAAMPRLCAS